MKAATLPPKARSLPESERRFMVEISESLQRHRNQGSQRLAELTRETFEFVLGESSKPTRQDKLALALARGIETRQKLAEAEGGSLSSEEVARMLGISKTAVLKRLNAGKMLAWQEERLGARRFPRWQFDEQGVLLSGMGEVLQCLKANPHLDDWAKILFFLQNKPSLGGQRPLDLLRNGRVKEAVQSAHAYAD